MEPALDNHLTGTLGGGEMVSHIGIICIALHLNFSLVVALGRLLLMHCSALNAAPHGHTSHECKYLRDIVQDMQQLKFLVCIDTSSRPLSENPFLHIHALDMRLYKASGRRTSKEDMDRIQLYRI